MKAGTLPRSFHLTKRERPIHADQDFQGYWSLQQVTIPFAVPAVKVAFSHFSIFQDIFLFLQHLPHRSHGVSVQKRSIMKTENRRTDPYTLNIKRKASALMATTISSFRLLNSTRCCHRAPTCRRSQSTNDRRASLTSDIRLPAGPGHAAVREPEEGRLRRAGFATSSPQAPGEHPHLCREAMPRTPRAVTRD